MSTLNVKHILLKNANKIYQFSSNYENIHEKKYNEEEKAFYSYVFLQKHQTESRINKEKEDSIKYEKTIRVRLRI